MQIQILFLLGYINESGHLNLPRFEKYLVKLSDVSNYKFLFFCPRVAVNGQ